MRYRIVILRAAAVILAALIVADGWAVPPSISSLATNTAFTAEEQESIQTYADYWSQQLAAGNDDPDSVRYVIDMGLRYAPGHPALLERRRSLPATE